MRKLKKELEENSIKETVGVIKETVGVITERTWTKQY